jgi:hypothetical protein
MSSRQEHDSSTCSACRQPVPDLSIDVVGECCDREDCPMRSVPWPEFLQSLDRFGSVQLAVNFAGERSSWLARRRDRNIRAALRRAVRAGFAVHLSNQVVRAVGRIASRRSH